MIDANQEIIIRKLVKQEILLSELYKIFSDKYPAYEDLWIEMSKDEKDHARWIRGFLKNIKKNLIIFDEGNLSIGFLETYIHGIERAIQKARDKNFTLKNAFTYAIDFETSLVERNIFGRFNSASNRVSELLKLIEKMTEMHMDKLIKEKELLYG